MSINGPLIDDYESREKHKKTPTIRCAKKTKKQGLHYPIEQN